MEGCELQTSEMSLTGWLPALRPTATTHERLRIGDEFELLICDRHWQAVNHPLGPAACVESQTRVTNK